MSLMLSYFDESVKHYAIRSHDHFGEPVYEVPCYVNVKREGYHKVISGSYGEQIMSSFKIYTNRPMVPRDMLELNGIKYPVIQTSAVKSISGAIDHFVAYV